MRLSRPLLSSAKVVSSEPWDLLGEFDDSRSAISADQDDFQQISQVGTSMILPQSFG